MLYNIMAVNLLVYDTYTLPKLCITSNIDVSTTASILYITTYSQTATSLGANAIYTGTSNNTLQFLGISSASTLNISTTNTTLYIELNTTAVTPGVYGSTSEIPRITVDSYGRITSILNQTIPDAGSSYAKMALYNQNLISAAIFFNGTIPVMPSAIEILGSSCIPNGWLFGPSSPASPISMTTNGRMTYTGASPKTFLTSASICGNFTAGVGVMLEIRKNGSNSGLINNFYYSGDSNGVASIVCSVAITLSNTDYVSIFLGRTSSMLNPNIYFAQMEIVNAT